jgi:DNA-3-methyladenine glycosylase
MAYLTQEFFARDTITVAQELIGAVLVVAGCEGRIVETEAYTTDAASHTVIRRNQASAMATTFGHVYVYFIYGMYYCLNFTTEREAIGAVLIRAVEPLAGIEEMKRRRRTSDIKSLASGPGKLCRAFGIDLDFNGRPVGHGIRVRNRRRVPEISSSPRIGIARATELEWRFYETGSPFVSNRRRFEPPS